MFSHDGNIFGITKFKSELGNDYLVSLKNKIAWSSSSLCRFIDAVLFYLFYVH